VTVGRIGVANDQNERVGVLVPNSINRDFLSPEEVKTLTPSEVIRRVTALRELIADNAAEAERLNHPVDLVWSAIRRTGVFYLFITRKFGGLESNLQTFIDVMLPIAEGCASTAWCTGFSIEHQWFVAQYPEVVQQEIWGRFPYITSAASGFPPGTAVRVDGGYRVTGRWRFASGIMHSDWVTPVALVRDASGKSTPFYFLIPIDQVTVYDTWKVDGMAGTGSHDFAAQEVFVPERLALNFAESVAGTLGHRSSFYRIPKAPLLALLAVVPALGAARGALIRFRARLATPGPEGVPIDRPLAQLALGRADMDLVAAELMIRDTARELEEIAKFDQPASASERVRLRTRLAYAADLCRNAVRTIHDVSGSSAHYLSNPSQRVLRDVTMISTHAVFEFGSSMELHGRVMIGLPSNNPLI
jgi:3-hydroxy-9,10-secoandrosta-1,3,5(10)-triene-9,17-dione monooxygenase